MRISKRATGDYTSQRFHAGAPMGVVKAIWVDVTINSPARIRSLTVPTIAGDEDDRRRWFDTIVMEVTLPFAYINGKNRGQRRLFKLGRA
jgi:hypothetical protein